MSAVATAPAPSPKGTQSAPSAGLSTTERLWRLALLLGFLYAFLVAISLMSGSIKLLGKETSTALFEGVSNPFAGLAVGVLATVLVQSSSTTTAMIVALVGAADSQLSISVAVPMIMGANIGTTVTNTLVSIGSVRRSREFRRAFSAATVHDFFNLMCVALFLPLEIATGFLSKSAGALTELMGDVTGGTYKSPIKVAVKKGFKAVVGLLEDLGLDGTFLAITVLVVGIGLTFVCLTQITRVMKSLLAGKLEASINAALERSGLVGIVIGMLMTAAVQSSSITTSLLVPMCASGVLTLRNAFPIMLGANLGTTITGLVASLATEQSAGLTIALVHTMFNTAGILVFYPIQRMRRIPLRLSRGLARKASGNPLWIVAYVLGVFVLLPLFGWWILR